MEATIEIENEIEFKVAVAIVVKGSKVLLVQRSVKEGTLNWQFPAGKLKSSESASNAAIREVYEETGIRCKIIKSLGSRRHPRTDVKLFYFVCDYVSGHETVKNHNETQRVEWVRQKDIKAYMPKEVLYPKLLDYFGVSF